jgi:hypothetical protein
MRAVSLGEWRCVMGYFDKLAQLGFAVICRRNPLGTTTMFAVRPEEMHLEMALGETFDAYLSDLLPDWRIVDFRDDDAAGGAKMLYEKLTCTGSYADRDERLLEAMPGLAGSGAAVLLIGFEHRPECERYQPVDNPEGWDRIES